MEQRKEPFHSPSSSNPVIQNAEIAKEELRKCFGKFLQGLGSIYQQCPIPSDFHQEFKNYSQIFSELGNITNTIINEGPQSDSKGIQSKKGSETETMYNVDFSYLFEDFEGTIYEALKILNLEAEQYGLKFKLGAISIKTGNKSSYAYLYCKLRSRLQKGKNKEKVSENEVEETEDRSPVKKKVEKGKHSKCQAYIGFKMTKYLNDKKSLFIFHSSAACHCHGPKTYQEITSTMSDEMIIFRKRRPIADIVTFLEHKHPGINLSYNKVYYHFRKLRPLLGAEDLDHLVSYLKEKEASVEYVKDLEDESVCKLIFCTKEMKENYKKFHDILLLDTTYKTNRYQVPLLVITGITSEGKNTLFGLCLLNQEDTTTYKWAISQFLAMNNQIKPQLIVTDQDLALVSAVEAFKSEHFLCFWHIMRNLRKKFSYLKMSSTKK